MTKLVTAATALLCLLPAIAIAQERMETFGIRDGLIHEVEVFPFVTVPYGWGNWTLGSGR